jgi:multiple sugar transport system permease protein
MVESLTTPGTKRRRRRGWESRWTGLAFVAPFVIGITVLFLLPMIAVPIVSLTRWSLSEPPQLVGLSNYQRLFADPTMAQAAGVTALFVALLVPINIALALVLALLLNVRAQGVGFFRTVLFSPVIVPVVAWSLVWRFALQPDVGLVNRALASLGTTGPNWLFQYPWAVVAVVASMVIEHVGLNMLIFLGALQSVPREILEAADVDGATKRQAFFKITMPLIAPTIFLVTIVTIIGALKAFTPILVLTGGSDVAGVLMVQVYKQGFRYFDFGYASSLAWLLFLAMLILTVVQWRLRRRWVFHEA